MKNLPIKISVFTMISQLFLNVEEEITAVNFCYLSANVDYINEIS